MTGIEQRMIELWQLLRAHSPEGARTRRRAAATSAMMIAVLALFVAVGLVELVVLFLAVGVSVLCLLGAAILLRRHHAQLRKRGVEITRRVIRAGIDGWTRGAALVAPAVLRARKQTSASVALASRCARAAERSLRIVTAESTEKARVAMVSVQRRAARPSAPVEPRRHAVRANALGVQLRRQGDCGTAAEHHRLALALFQEIGDRRAEALTLNSLALALEHAGDARALELFEEAATMLGELGDEQNEGQVIANLAVAYRRRGQEEESDEALETALAKLEPESNAYRKAERLRRAS